MEEWIRNTFELMPGGFDGDDGPQDAFAFESGGRKVIASLPIFLGLFGAAPAPPTASALKALQPSHQGWHRHFDAWVEQGIIAAE